jgi:hypothetical protein
MLAMMGGAPDTGHEGHAGHGHHEHDHRPEGHSHEPDD